MGFITRPDWGISPKGEIGGLVADRAQGLPEKNNNKKNQ